MPSRKWLSVKLSKQVAVRLGCIGIIVPAVVMMVILNFFPNSKIGYYTSLITHFILEDIIETVCCFIPALLLGTIGPSITFLNRRRI